MKKYLLLMAMLIGSSVMGFSRTPPQLIYVSSTSTSITLELQAGSDALPSGFEVSFQLTGGLKRTMQVFGDGDCSQYALLPGQISPPFTLDGVTNGTCEMYNQTLAFTPATPYRFFARYGDIISTGITVQTQQ